MSGTPFNCDGCGACCERVGYPPFTDNDQADLEAMERQHPELVAAIRRAGETTRRAQGLPCTWLDPQSKRCLHYELRPKICRDFALGSPKCLELRWLKGIPT